jgi:hypothetical protein
MANQQERLADDLHWLGGIIDGEGWFSIAVRRDPKRRMHLVPEIGIGNTSDVMVREVLRILADAYLPVWVSTRPAGVSKRTMVSTTMYARGPKRVKRWLAVLLPFVRAKRHDAVTVLNYVDSRLAKPHVAPYSEEEIGWSEELRGRHGNRKRESSETIRQTLARQIIGAPKGNLNRLGGVKIESDLTAKA